MKKKRKHRVYLLTILVITLLIGYVVFALKDMQARVTDASEAEQQLEQRVTQLQEENAALQYAIEHKDDPKTIEDIARDKLGLVMPDDKLFYDSGQ